MGGCRGEQSLGLGAGGFLWDAVFAIAGMLFCTLAPGVYAYWWKLLEITEYVVPELVLCVCGEELSVSIIITLNGLGQMSGMLRLKLFTFWSDSQNLMIVM